MSEFMLPLDDGDGAPSDSRDAQVGAAHLFGCSWRTLADQLGLSAREGETVEAIFDGLGEKEMASRMGISMHTVRTHMKRLYRKVGVHSRGQLLTLVVRQALELNR